MNMLRVENAVNRLKNTTDTISEIALDCGFGDIRNFNRVFRQYTNYTPSDFRKLKSLGTYMLSFPHRKTPQQVLVENDSLVVIDNKQTLDKTDIAKITGL